MRGLFDTVTKSPKQKHFESAVIQACFLILWGDIETFIPA
jgi:hypothetical protein